MKPSAPTLNRGHPFTVGLSSRHIPVPRKKTPPLTKPKVSRQALRAAQQSRLRRELVALTQALKREKAKKVPTYQVPDMTLTPSQERFCHEWLTDHNGVRAYRVAYPEVNERTATSAASRLLTNSKVTLRLANLMHAQLQAIDFDAAEVLRYIRDGCRFDIRRLFDPETGRPKAFNELTYEEASQIEGYEIIMKNAEAGDGQIDRVLKVKLTPRKQFIELAAIHFQLLVEQINVSGSLMVVDERGTDAELYSQVERILETAKRRAMGLTPGSPAQKVLAQP